MSDQESRKIVEEAVDTAIHRTFQLLGVDTRDQESINRLRADLDSAREVRLWKEKAAGRFWLIMLGAAMMALGMTLWEGVKAGLHKVLGN